MPSTSAGTHMNVKGFTAANAEIIATRFNVAIRLFVDLDRFIAAVCIVAPLIFYSIQRYLNIRSSKENSNFSACENISCIDGWLGLIT